MPDPQAERAGSSDGFDPARGLVRIQIHALLSGDVAWCPLGPELLSRFQNAIACAGQSLQLLEINIVPSPLLCPRCGEQSLYRAERKGFLRIKILPLFGIYPWNCAECRRSVLLRRRSPLPVQSPRMERREAA